MLQRSWRHLCLRNPNVTSLLNVQSVIVQFWRNRTLSVDTPRLTAATYSPALWLICFHGLTWITICAWCLLGIYKRPFASTNSEKPASSSERKCNLLCKSWNLFKSWPSKTRLNCERISRRCWLGDAHKLTVPGCDSNDIWFRAKILCNMSRKQESGTFKCRDWWTLIPSDCDFRL